MSYYSNSGYIGQSMSVRAQEAYDSGEMPKSKWTKDAILSALLDYDLTDEQYAKVSTYGLDVLKEVFLSLSSWHHTGKYFNETDFYTIDQEAVDMIISNDYSKLDKWEFIKKESKEKKKAKASESFTKAYIVYEENIGTRKHPRFGEFKSYCLIKGDWAYLPDGKKKNLDGKHIISTEAYARAPKGTAAIFKKLEKKWK